jgi:catalase
MPLAAPPPFPCAFPTLPALPRFPTTILKEPVHAAAPCFDLAEHVHTDIVSHSANGFPTRTAEELLEFFRAIPASAPSVPQPTPVEVFVSRHPAALAFVQIRQAVSNELRQGAFLRCQRLQIHECRRICPLRPLPLLPEIGTEYLEAEGAAAKTPNYLFDELFERIAAGPIKVPDARAAFRGR